MPVLIGFLVAILAVVILYRTFVEVEILRSKRMAAFERVAGLDAQKAEAPSREPRTLAEKLRAAGLDLGRDAATMFQLICVTLGVLAAAGALAFGLPPIVALLAGAGGFVYPRMWLADRAQMRGRVIESELPGALGDLTAILRVTPALQPALDQTMRLLREINPQSPLAQEFAWTLEDVTALGETGAFQALAQRAASPALATLAFALSIFTRTGGDYLNALEAQARGVRETLEARGAAQTEAADAMMSLRAIPAILFLVSLGLMQDPLFRAFYFSFAGQIVLAVCIGAMILGYQLVKSMVSEVA